MSGRPLALALLLSLSLLPTACSSSTGPSAPNIKGTWAGSVFKNSVNLTISTESGGTVSGTIMVTGATTVGGDPFNGQLDSATRQLTWTMNVGCQAWSGTLDVSSNGSQMSGPASVDESTCNPPAALEQSTMSLNKQ